MSHKKLYISVEGNIGTGKSTFLKILEKHWGNDNIEYSQEPVDKWTQYIEPTENENILSKFYKDKKRWGYTFQTVTFKTRVARILEARKTNNHIISERCILTDKLVFAQSLHDSGDMSEMEWHIYNEWHSWLLESFNMKPDYIIYLRAKPEISFERLQKRNRREESSVLKDYISRIHTYHNEWLGQTNIPVIIIDADDDYLNDNIKQSAIIKQITDRIKNLM